MNTCFLLGNLVKDPEARLTSEGTMVTTFSMATNKKVKDKEYTQFHNVVVWGNGPDQNGQAGAVADHLKKGSKVLVRGEIQTRSYEDKDGNKRYTTEIVAERFGGVTFLDGKGRQTSSEEYQPHDVQPDDDIPF